MERKMSYTDGCGSRPCKMTRYEHPAIESEEIDGGLTRNSDPITVEKHTESAPASARNTSNAATGATTSAAAVAVSQWEAWLAKVTRTVTKGLVDNSGSGVGGVLNTHTADAPVKHSDGTSQTPAQLTKCDVYGTSHPACTVGHQSLAGAPGEPVNVRHCTSVSPVRMISSFPCLPINFAHCAPDRPINLTGTSHSFMSSHCSAHELEAEERIHASGPAKTVDEATCTDSEPVISSMQEETISTLSSAELAADVPEPNSAISSKIEAGNLKVYAAMLCPEEHYKWLSRWLAGDGQLHSNRLLLTIPLPVVEPETSKEIVGFFAPGRPWCSSPLKFIRASMNHKDTITRLTIRAAVCAQMQAVAARTAKRCITKSHGDDEIISGCICS